MRALSILLLLVFPIVFWGQSPPIDWKVNALKVDATHYQLNIDATIPEGWILYAANESEGIEGLVVTWEGGRVAAAGKLENSKAPKRHRDRVFGKPLYVYNGKVSWQQALRIQGNIPAQLLVTLQGYAARGDEFLPFSLTKLVDFEGGRATAATALLLAGLDKPLSDCGRTAVEGGNTLFHLFLLGFAGGLIALLTPCVFPMIPVTVSFFTNRAATRRQGISQALLYAGLILGIYVLASIPFFFLSNISPQVFNTISTNAWVNLLFFAVFIFFALSFFGLFEIQLPSSLTNNVGSRGGILFMALTLVTVSFSCTGPILGSLLVGSLSSSGGAWQLTCGMGGFGTALALPFGLFALFPQWLRNLPRSGSWLLTVKKSLAFVELALALKFLSNADLVEHWGLLKREVFIGLWILIAIALGLYLLGVFDKKEADGAALQKLSKGRVVLGIGALLFSLYLLPGLTSTPYARLPLLSGFPPPLSYSIYNHPSNREKGAEPVIINDYKGALQMAKAQNKPLLIDFTGWACVNCRKMEEGVWTEPAVKQLIEKEFILVSLYVDDRKELPVEAQFLFTNKKGETRQIRTVGDKWATFQAQNFGQVTQPLYVLLSPQGQLLNTPVGYTSNASEYLSWLQCGVTAFKKRETKQ